MKSIDPNTTIIFEQQGVFDDIPACYQTWQYDGIQGDCIIFNKKDLGRYNEIELIAKVRSSNLVKKDSPITLGRHPKKYLFINFNISLG